MTESVHKTVLLNEAIDGLNLKNGSIFFDGTLGGGGHSELVCERYDNVQVIGVDRDIDALRRVEEKLKDYKCKKHLILANFRDIDKVLKDLNVESVDGILLDLGLSSDQFEVSGRGFTFKNDEPLLMTFSSDAKTEINAQKIVNEWSEETIADILFGYADERFARRIAKKIVEVREQKPILTTFELLDVIKSSVPVAYTKGKTHYATKTFQALRIAVNDEMESLKDGLKKGFIHLNKGGRMAVISFHSTEDRVVKNFFREIKNNKQGLLINKKPIIPTEEELKVNPRARSAKMRILEKQ